MSLDTLTAYLPKPDSPTYPMALIVLSALAAYLMPLWLRKGRPKQDEETRAIPITARRPTDPTPCGEHDRRMDRLENELTSFYNTITDRLQSTERVVRESITTGLAQARTEQDRRLADLKSDIKGDMERLETRVSDKVAERLTAFETGLVSQIRLMFLEDSDGVKVLRPIRPKE